MELNEIIKRAWEDPDFKNQLIKNPNAVLEKEGVQVPKGIRIIVHENTDQECHLTIPKKHKGEISEQELQEISGGQFRHVFWWDAQPAERSIGGPYPAPPSSGDKR